MTLVPCCGCDGCCTTRLLDAAELGSGSGTASIMQEVWRDSIHPQQKCNAVVTDNDSIDGDLYQVGYWQEGSITRVRAQRWDAAGNKVWDTELPVSYAYFRSYGPEAKPLRISTDGEFVWVGVAGRQQPGSGSGSDDVDVTPNLLQLDAATGDINWAIQTGYLIRDVVHNEQGQVYTGTLYEDGGYLSLWDEDGSKIGENFGGLPKIDAGDWTVSATNLDFGDGHIYVGQDDKTPRTLSLPPDCFPQGHICKYDEEQKLIWRWYPVGRPSEVGTPEPPDGYGFEGQVRHPTTGIKYHAGFLYVCYRGFVGYDVDNPLQVIRTLPAIQKWDVETCDVIWGRNLEADPSDTTFTEEKAHSITTDGTYVWTGGSRHLWTHDVDGNIIACDPHGLTGQSPGGKRAILAVAASIDHSVYTGGPSASCPSGNVSQPCSDNPLDCKLPCDPDRTPEESVLVNTGLLHPLGGVIPKHCQPGTGSPGAIRPNPIPCIIEEVFYGIGCFEGFETPYRWELITSTGNPIWQTTPPIFIPCGTGGFSLTLQAVEETDEDCEGWRVTYVAILVEGEGTGSDSTEGCPTILTGDAEILACHCDPYPWFEWLVEVPLPDCLCCINGFGGGTNVPEDGSGSGSGTGTGTGTGTGEEPNPPITTACCLSGTALTRITATFSGCLSGSITLVNSTGLWAGSGTIGGCFIDMTLSCAPPFNEWRLDILGVCSTSPASSFLPQSHCDPLVLVFAGLIPSNRGTCSCCPSGSFTITVTET